MKVLLTGATGFLGYRTLELFVKVPEITEVIAGGRKIRPTHFIDHPKVEYRLGDLSDPDYVSDLVQNADAIIHAAALSSPWGKYADFVKSNIKTQQNLIYAAQKYRISKYIYISTPSIYFELKDKFNISETDPLPSKFINGYAETKHKAELLLQNAAIPYVILRPRALIGRGDTVIMPRLLRAYQEGQLKIIGSGHNIVDLTSVANVADSILLSLFADKEAINQIYNITNGEPVKLWEAVEEMITALGFEFSRKKLPYMLVKFIAQCMELKSKLTDMKEPALTLYGVGTLSKSTTLNISRAKELLKYQPKITTSAAIAEFANWYNQYEKN